MNSTAVGIYGRDSFLLSLSAVLPGKVLLRQEMLRSLRFSSFG